MGTFPLQTLFYSHHWSTITIYLFSFDVSVMNGHLLCTIRDYKYIDILLFFTVMRTKRSDMRGCPLDSTIDFYFILRVSWYYYTWQMNTYWFTDQWMTIKLYFVGSVGDFILTRLPIFLHILTPTHIQAVSDWSGFVC